MDFYCDEDMDKVVGSAEEQNSIYRAMRRERREERRAERRQKRLASKSSSSSQTTESIITNCDNFEGKEIERICSTNTKGYNHGPGPEANEVDSESPLELKKRAAMNRALLKGTVINVRKESVATEESSDTYVASSLPIDVIMETSDNEEEAYWPVKLNLKSRAVKFSDNGTVEVDARIGSCARSQFITWRSK